MTQLQKSQGTIQRRHSQRQKKRIRMMKIRRTVFFSLLTLIAVFVILFYTPLFKIRSIEIVGNQKVNSAQIVSCLGDTEGKNLFRAKISLMKKNIMKIPYIESAEIDRVILRSKLLVTVTECDEAAFLAGGSGYIVIDSAAKVLSEVTEKPSGIPEVTGLSVSNISIGEKLKIAEQDKFEIMILCIEEMEKIEILSGVKGLSVADTSNISFNYEDRLDVICGSNVDLVKKLGFFKSAVNSSRLTENSRGTIDLTTIGKAIYTP